MKRLFAIGLCLGMLATAGATAISIPASLASDAGLSGRTRLTVEQTKALQARYRYWSSSQTMTLKTPI
jgi:hypothetical protein